jgi:hypothetical protein
MGLNTKTILDTTTNTTGSTFTDYNPGGAFQAVITGSGAVTANVAVQASLDGVNWLTLGTIALTGTAPQTDGFVNQGEWCYYRAVSSGVTGTVTRLTCMMTEWA